MKATLELQEVPLGGGRLLRIARFDRQGRESQLVLSVGFEDDPVPLAAGDGIYLPIGAAPAVRKALETLETVE